MIKTVTIIGTGLIGASVGLGMQAAGFAGEIAGVDTSAAELECAVGRGAVTRAGTPEDAARADLVILAVPVLATMDWMERLAPRLGPHQLITDVGSTKRSIAMLAQQLRESGAANAKILPGHPMAGKELGGAALADASLFQGAMWLFTPVADSSPIEFEWRSWVERMGARTLDMDAARHDELLAWVSHLPQMLSTALAAMLEERFGQAPESAVDLMRVGGRALREATRLGASPYSMWRDVAMTNTEAIAATLLALEGELAYVRENLRTPELRDEFTRANRFRARRD